jgi:putative peptidoglycan lipid II flippase
VAVLGGLLNTRRVYFLPLSIQTWMNLVWIAAVIGVAFTIGPEHGLTVVGASVVLACAIGVWVLLVKARKLGIPISLRTDGFRDPAFKEFLGKFLLTLIGVASYPFNLLCDRLIAQFIVGKEGAVTFLYQGDRLMQVPLGVIAMSVGAVALAEMSAKPDDHERFHSLFTRTMTISFFTALPVVGVFCLLAPQIVDLSLNWLQFSKIPHLDPLTRTANVLICYSFAMPAFFVNTALTRAFYAQGDMWTPVRLTWWMFAANIVLNFLLLLFTSLDEAALALASGLVAYLNMFLLIALIRKRFAWLSLAASFRQLPAMLLSLLLGSAALWGCVELIGGSLGGSLLERSVRFFVPATAFMAAYLGSAHLLGVREVRALLRR